jgi:hypothetical protein
MSEHKPEWQPMETAPTGDHRTRVLFCVPGYGVQIGHYRADRRAKKPRPFWTWSDLYGIAVQRANQPTAWMPLPAQCAACQEHDE